MPAKIAIVGSGPAGCYTAQALRKALPQAEMTIFERLPVPFGLVRYGVAADHQGTKAVRQQFERLFSREGISFAGNIEVGRDLSLAELQSAFDVVVLATGLSGDRRLNIPGSELDGVYGAGHVTRLFNDHPDDQSEAVTIGPRAVVVGNGNVAIDVIRLLIKPGEAFEGSDLSDDTRARIIPRPIERIDVFGRSPAPLAKFDAAMIAELADLPNIHYIVPAGVDGLPTAENSRVAALSNLRSEPSGRDAGFKTRKETVVQFHFGWVPERIDGDGRVHSVTALPTGGGEGKLVVSADSVITAIGFEEHPLRDFRRSTLEAPGADVELGRLADGLYCAGWFKLGPRGTIPENRAAARKVAQTIVDDLTNGRLAICKPGRAALPPKALDQLVDYDGWRKIDDAEAAAAPPGRIRRKLRNVTDMLAVAAGDGVDSADGLLGKKQSNQVVTQDCAGLR